MIERIMKKYICPVCQTTFDERVDACPKCGARFKKKEESNKAPLENKAPECTCDKVEYNKEFFTGGLNERILEISKAINPFFLVFAILFAAAAIALAIVGFSNENPALGGGGLLLLVPALFFLLLYFLERYKIIVTSKRIYVKKRSLYCSSYPLKHVTHVTRFRRAIRFGVAGHHHLFPYCTNAVNTVAAIANRSVEIQDIK